ncbi:MAG: methionine ABC transporter permease [Lacrimispora sp.]|uniref:methionine ABC transporter permease n=1 Tax=Lacrimispora sp. TaxID=2719234 RepID=UPI0039E48412
MNTISLWLERSYLFQYFPSVIVPAVFATLQMVFVSAILSIFFGMILGIILFITDKNGLSPNPGVNYILGKVTDIVRSFPTMILIVAIAPLTRLVLGTRIGTEAAIFAITIGCTPFATRMTENSLQTVDPQLIKAAKAFGASKPQIVYKIMLVEALPSLVSNFTIMLINMLNMTAMAGAVGAGGLGAVALTYGYQRFDYAIMYFIVAILILLVLLIQGLGKMIYNKLN